MRRQTDMGKILRDWCGNRDELLCLESVIDSIRHGVFAGLDGDHDHLRGQLASCKSHR
jgi:hypothetical protein